MRMRRFRVPLKIAYDSAAWVAATAVATVLRFQRPDDVPWEATVYLALALGATYFLVGILVRLHQGRAQTGSLEDMLLVGCVATSAGVFVFAANLTHVFVPRSVPVGATICFVVAAALGRAMWRTNTERPLSAGVGSTSSTRVLVVGAGEAARELIGSMLRDPMSEWHPVGLIEDDRTRAPPPHPRRTGAGQHRRDRRARPGDRRGRPRRGDPERPVRDDRPDRGGRPLRGGRREGAPVDVGAASRQRRDPRSPRHQPGRRARPQAGRHRRRLDRRLSDRAARPGDRRGRLDRFRALPADLDLRSGRADHARPRRVGAPRGAAVPDGSRPARRS